MPSPSPSTRDRIELLESIAVVAVEFERELDLMRLVTYIDLYGHALGALGPGDRESSFEAFVADADALGASARLAERASGVPTAAPAPLGAPHGGD